MTPADEAEFRDWATARRDHLRRSAYLLCQDWHHAEDLTQTTLVKVAASWRRIRRRDAVEAFARRVLVNVFLDETRRPWRRETSVEALPDMPVSYDDAADRAPLLAALRQVPPGQRAVLVLRYWEDLSVAQVADLLNMSTGNVKSQAARGLANLREVLGPEVLAGEELR